MTATPEGGGSGSGGATVGSGPGAAEGLGDAEDGRLRARAGAGGAPRFPWRPWRRKKVTGRGPTRQLPPEVPGESGGGTRGPEAWAAGGGRPGPRGEGGKVRGGGGGRRFAEKFRRSRVNGPKFYPPKWEERWSLKLGIG